MRTIDLRSDTVTQPTDQMRRAIAEAVVGDDVYGDDITINRLEAIAAEILHKEAAIFVPSGTFGNQLALLTHCRRGDEVILADDCHIVCHEGGASALIAGVQLRTTESEYGQIPPAVLEARIRKDKNDLHQPHTGLICLENAFSNGLVLPLDYMREVYENCRKIRYTHTFGRGAAV
jgi:threonine aldolase